MEESQMIITRKLEIKVANEGEQKQESYKLLKEYSDNMHKISNFIVNNMYMNDMIQDKFVYHDKILKEKVEKADIKIKDLYSKRGKQEHLLKSEEDKDKVKKLEDSIQKHTKDIEKAVKDKNNLTTESSKEFREQFRDIYNIQFSSSLGQYIRSEFPTIPDTILSPAISELGFYGKEMWKVKTGQESLKTFRKGMPFNTRGRDLKFLEDGSNVYINWVKKIVFKINFGRDNSNNRYIIDKVLDGTYKVCDSSISHGKKTFLNLCIDIPENEHKLDEDMVLGVDLGLAVPAYISTNKGYFRQSLGSIGEFLRIRTQMQARLKQLQKDVVLARGGHGRARKTQALDRLYGKERAWVKTYNHKISKAIIDGAIKNQCKTINLEFLKGYGKKETNDFVLRNWSYFELQQFIEYKAKKNGISVTYIDPYHTSQTCSQCGHYEKGQRLNQKNFKCKSCGFEDNADYNASRNIAKSTQYVDSIQDCQYYKLKAKNKDKA